MSAKLSEYIKDEIVY